MKKLKIILITLSALIIIFVVSALVYANTYYKANEVALEYMESSTTVNVSENNDYILFEPLNYETGVIIYPGGKVDEKAYATLAHKLAKNNILVAIVKMPMKLAILNINGANKVLEDFNLTNWYIMGHSLGGAMAANYLEKNHSKFEGLIMLAAYATSSLKNTDLDVLLIKGENDLVINETKYQEGKNYLPNDYSESILVGGNHAYFGSYGEQSGDGKASIMPMDQIDLTIASILNYLEN